MEAELPRNLTLILGKARAEDERARGDLVALVYDELRRVASRLMRRDGMTVPEVAAALGVAVVTVERDWRLARAWLAGQLGGGDG